MRQLEKDTASELKLMIVRDRKNFFPEVQLKNHFSSVKFSRYSAEKIHNEILLFFSCLKFNFSGFSAKP